MGKNKSRDTKTSITGQGKVNAYQLPVVLQCVFVGASMHQENLLNLYDKFLVFIFKFEHMVYQFHHSFMIFVSIYKNLNSFSKKL